MDQHARVARRHAAIEFVSIVAKASVISIASASGWFAFYHMGLLVLVMSLTPFGLLVALPFWPPVMVSSAVCVGLLKLLFKNRRRPLARWKAWALSLVLAVTVGFIVGAIPPAIVVREWPITCFLGLFGSAGGLAPALLLTDHLYRKWQPVDETRGREGHG